MRTWAGTVTVITNYPEPPIGFSVAASNAWLAASRAVRQASKKRPHGRGGTGRRIVGYTIVLRRGPTIKGYDETKQRSDGSYRSPA